MTELKITDLVDEKEIEQVKQLGLEIEKVKSIYGDAAKELAKGLKMNVEVVGDLDKLNAVIITQAKKADGATNDLNAALKKQSELAERVAKSLDEQIKSGNLSATQMKKLTDASKKNAESLEKLAKAEATVEKAQRASNTAKKSANVTEQERQKIITDAIAATYKEIHSIQEANDMNRLLRKAVKLVRDTDEEYIQTIGRLNSTIGVNTDYVKRNSDRYTQQKMTVGDYTESIKRAWMEIQRGNSAMKNMGIIAKSTGNLLKTSFNSGISQVTIGVGSMIKGMLGAQAVIAGIQKLTGAIRQGVNTAIDFEAANSKLAAILGTTKGEIKDLTADARRLGEATKYTASEATNLQIELSKLGFSKTEILDMTEGVLKFAQATGAELPEAAALAGAALRMFGADTEETERYVSAMAVATTKSALSFSYLQTAMPIVGPVAKAFNFTIEDTLALLGKLADAGFDASMSATATRNILLNLADGSGKLAQALGGPVKTLPELVDGLKRLKEQGIDLNSTLEMTDKRSVAAFNAFLTASDKIVPLRDQITGVEDDLNKMADTMGNNVQGALYNLSSAWESLMLTIMDNTGAMKDFIDMATNGIRKINEWLMNAEQLADKQVETAKRAASPYAEESIKSEIIAINRLKDEYLKAGDDETTSLEKAKNERIAILEQELSKQQSLRNKFYNENQQLWKDMRDASFFKQAFGLEKTNAEFSEKQTKTWNEYLDKVTKVTSLEKQIADIRKISNSIDDASGTSTTLTDKQKKKLEKQRKEQLRIDKAYQQSRLELMDEGLEKQIKSISLNYSRQIAAIRGNSEEESATRNNLAEKMEKEISDAKIKFALDAEKNNLSNRMAIIQKGTQEELDLKIKMLDLEREEEMNTAEKSGEDVFLIDEKYKKKRQGLLEEFASEQILQIADNAAAEQAVRDRQFQTDLLNLKRRKETENMSSEQYAEEEYLIKLDYVRKTTEAAIDAIEQELNVDNLSAKDRKKLTEELCKLKADLANKEADAEITAIEKINKAEEKAYKERIKNLKKWLQTASQAVSTIGDLVGTLYDGQLDKIEEESEANTDAHDSEIERIELLKEQKIISEEEAQARKRAAEDKTRKKEEELEKRRQDIQYKQAVWDKAANIANASIATALAITEALPNFVLAALVGAMGAVQVATIMATPIPKYAKGTDNHTGGPAIVGDGGKKEIVVYSGKAWITPDVPTLVDLPRGTQVLPDASLYHLSSVDFPNISQQHVGKTENNIVVNNDYSSLNHELKGMRSDMRKMAKQQHRDAYDFNYELYKRTRL
jgi:TP901 family phage tail tape measure protein